SSRCGSGGGVTAGRPLRRTGWARRRHVGPTAADDPPCGGCGSGAGLAAGRGPRRRRQALLLQGQSVGASCWPRWRCVVLASAACSALGVGFFGLRGIGAASPSWNSVVGMQEERHCTAVAGHDVWGDILGPTVGKHPHVSFEQCKTLCMNSQSGCGCYAWDVSRGRTCWLKRNCGDFYVWGETDDMVAGRCAGPVPPPPTPSPTAVPPTPSPTAVPPTCATDAVSNSCATDAVSNSCATDTVSNSCGTDTVSNSCGTDTGSDAGTLPAGLHRAWPQRVRGAAWTGEVSGTSLEGAVELTAEGCHTACELRAECGCYEFDPSAAPARQCTLMSQCRDFNDVDEPKVSGSCQICDWCTPKLPSTPDLVIPFFERDMCKMRMTAASIEAHDPHHFIGDVHLLWLSKKPPSDYANDIEYITGVINKSHKSHLHDMSFMFSETEIEGWFLQQVMKLKAASLVQAPFYVVLDAKNTFIKDVEQFTFMSPCNTGLIYADSDFSSLGEKQDWYLKSADALGVSLPQDRKWSASVTPVVMHTKTVKDMLGQLSEDATPWELCSGPLCGYIEKGATEFALYYSYIAAVSDERCIHATVPKSPAVAFWRGIDGDTKESTCNSVAGGERGVVMFGAQSGADSEFDEDQRKRIAACFADIYASAGLHDPERTSDAVLMQCVVGA
ncbi:unnamed protein product, partial [Prorocentrum cordatum]